MKILIALLFASFICSNLTAQEYKGTVVLKTGTSMEGSISQLDLTGENKGLIYVETGSSTVSKKKREKTTMTVSQKNGYNPALISRIVIDGSSYQFKDLRFGYNDNEILENCLVQKYSGNDSLAIYQWKNAKGSTGYYICTPRFTDYAEDINHPKYDEDGFSSFVTIKFSRCSVLAKKIYEKTPGYTYSNQKNSTEEKLAVWKKIMEEYMHCF